MSRSFVASHFPTSPVAPIGFLVLCFPFIPPALPLFSFLSPCVPFSSPLFPFHVPLLSCHVDFLFPPLISLHFLAFPLCSPRFPAKNVVFPAFSQLGRPKTQSFSRFSAKGGRNPKQQRAGRGNQAWDPCFATPAPKTTFGGMSSNCRAVRGGGNGEKGLAEGGQLRVACSGFYVHLKSVFPLIRF